MMTPGERRGSGRIGVLLVAALISTLITAGAFLVFPIAPAGDPVELAPAHPAMQDIQQSLPAARPTMTMPETAPTEPETATSEPEPATSRPEPAIPDLERDTFGRTPLATIPVPADDAAALASTTHQTPSADQTPSGEQTPAAGPSPAGTDPPAGSADPASSPESGRPSGPRQPEPQPATHTPAQPTENRTLPVPPAPPREPADEETHSLAVTARATGSTGHLVLSVSVRTDTGPVSVTAHLSTASGQQQVSLVSDAAGSGDWSTDQELPPGEVTWFVSATAGSLSYSTDPLTLLLP